MKKSDRPYSVEEKTPAWLRIKFWFFFSLYVVVPLAYAAFWMGPRGFGFTFWEKVVFIGLLIVGTAGMILNKDGASSTRKKYF